MPKSKLVNELDQVQVFSRAGLRPLGFRMKGRTFNRQTNDGLIQVINFQANRFGPTFAVNLGIYIPEVASYFLNAPKATWMYEYRCHIRNRIGRGGIDGTDMWWTIREPETLGPKIWSRLENQALPYLSQHANRDLVLGELLKDLDQITMGPSPRQICACIYHARGDDDQAHKIMNELVAKCKRPAQEESLRAVAGRMGLTL